MTATSFKQVRAALHAAVVAFLAYACVYVYRKPFTVATFNGLSFFGVPYQTLLIISQVIGYMFSKFFGIRMIAELKRMGRWKTGALLIGIAWLSLLLFALVPPPFGIICMFVNGFALGFMWGIVFSYVEGRRATDFIGSAMAVSFIFSGGFCRSIGKWLLDVWHVPEAWMPFVAGLLFVGPFAVLFVLLERIPAPDAADVAERTVRLPMNRTERGQFLRLFGAGIAFVTVTYLFLTVMRDVRDNYMTNLWSELGYGKNYSIFTQTETITSLIVLAMMSLLVLVRNNMLAFRLIHWIVLAGFLIAGISSLLYLRGTLDGAWWMQLTGLGLYMAYIPFNCIFFERMIASFRLGGNVGFLIYIADAFGYLASVAVMLVKEAMHLNLTWVSFYSHGVVAFSVIGIAGILVSLLYFNRKYFSENEPVYG